VYPNDDPSAIKYFGFVNMALAIFGLLEFRKSPFLGPIWLALSYIFYSITIGRLVVPDIAESINNVIGYQYDLMGQFIIFLFILSLRILLHSDLKKFADIEFPKKNSVNNTIAVAAIFVAITMQFFFSEAVDGGRAAYTPVYEYSVVFCILSVFYARNSLLISLLVSGTIFLMIMRDFYLGHRATALQLSLLIYAVYFSRYYSVRRLMIIFFGSLLLFNLVAAYRSDFELSSATMYESITRLITQQYFAADTAYFAWVASLSFIAVRDLASAGEIFKHSADFLLSMLVVGTVGENLYTISKKYYAHVHGGILPVYLYYYLGFLAAPISSALVAGYLNITVALKGGALRDLLFIYIFSTAPRWLLYSPTPLIRGALIFILVVLSVDFLRNILFKSSPHFIRGLEQKH
jgi:hypothetical protein